MSEAEGTSEMTRPGPLSHLVTTELEWKWDSPWRHRWLVGELSGCVPYFSLWLTSPPHIPGWGLLPLHQVLKLRQEPGSGSSHLPHRPRGSHAMMASWTDPGWGGSLRSLARKQKEEEEEVKPWRKRQRAAMEVAVVDGGRLRHCLAPGSWGGPGVGEAPPDRARRESCCSFSLLYLCQCFSIQMPCAGQVSVSTPAICPHQPPAPYPCHPWDLGGPMGRQGPCLPGALCEVQRSV